MMEMIKSLVALDIQSLSIKMCLMWQSCYISCLPGVCLATASGSFLCVGGEAVLELTVLVDGALAGTDVTCVDGSVAAV